MCVGCRVVYITTSVRNLNSRPKIIHPQRDSPVDPTAHDTAGGSTQAVSLREYILCTDSIYGSSAARPTNQQKYLCVQLFYVLVLTTATGFEPVQVEPSCLAGNRLSHSAKLSGETYNIFSQTRATYKNQNILRTEAGTPCGESVRTRPNNIFDSGISRRAELPDTITKI